MDKEKAVIVLVIAEYVAKVENTLEDPVYKRIRNNPVKKVENEVSLLVVGA